MKILHLSVINMFIFSVIIISASFLSKVYSKIFVLSYFILIYSTIIIIVSLILAYYNKNEIIIMTATGALGTVFPYPYFLAVIILVLRGKDAEILNITFGPVLKVFLLLLLFIPTAFIDIIIVILLIILAIYFNVKECKTKETY